jgi:hypothetical protein
MSAKRQRFGFSPQIVGELGDYRLTLLQGERCVSFPEPLRRPAEIRVDVLPDVTVKKVGCRLRCVVLDQVRHPLDQLLQFRPNRHVPLPTRLSAHYADAPRIEFIAHLLRRRWRRSRS